MVPARLAYSFGLVCSAAAYQLKTFTAGNTSTQSPSLVPFDENSTAGPIDIPIIFCDGLDSGDACSYKKEGTIIFGACKKGEEYGGVMQCVRAKFGKDNSLIEYHSDDDVELASKSAELLHATKKSAGVFADWKLCDADVHSNLGGQGPDSGDENIRYKNVATTPDGDALDFVVTNTTPYEFASTTNNGKSVCFGLFNVLSLTEVTLLFRLVHAGTDELALGHNFFVTVYDIDKSKKKVREDVTFITPVAAYYLMPDTELNRSGSGAALTFSATEFGTAKDNPTSSEHLTDTEERRAVTVEYDNLAEFSVHFSAGADGELSKKEIKSIGKSGRNFMFAGYSSMVENAPAINWSDCSTGDCEVWGDPHVSGFDNEANGPLFFLAGHMSTFDRHPLDVNAYEAGDIWLVKSDAVHIQGRYAPSPEFGENRSAVGAIAIGGDFLGGGKLIIEAKNGEVKWNEYALADQSNLQTMVASGDIVNITCYYNGDDPSVDVVLPSRVSLKVRRYRTHIDAKITMPKASGVIDGQCGNFNGDAADDTMGYLESRNSLVVPASELLFSS